MTQPISELAITADDRPLVARLEKATGPDRELDREILFATFPKERTAIFDGVKHISTTTAANGDFWFLSLADRHDVPDYTASIDAALTLVPAGMGAAFDTRPHTNQDRSDVPAVAWVSEYRDEPCIPSIAATPALALCIAALKALTP